MICSIVRHISLTFFTKCKRTQSLWLLRKRPKKKEPTSKRETQTQRKRKNKPGFTANDFNSLQQCCSCTDDDGAAVEYAWPRERARKCYCCTDDDGGVACRERASPLILDIFSSIFWKFLKHHTGLPFPLPNGR